MFLSAHDVALSRERALSNLLELSAACLQSWQQLTAELVAAGRDSLCLGDGPWPFAWWLDNLASAGRLYDEARFILGNTQMALIRSADQQVRIVDALAVAAIYRAHKTCPWEIEPALGAMKDSLQLAEQILHTVSEAALEAVERSRIPVIGNPA